MTTAPAHEPSPPIEPEATPEPLPAHWSRRLARRAWTWMTWRNLMIALIVIHLIPVWTVSYLPTQDGPAHIYNSKIFFESFSRENYQVRQFYEVGYQLYPNMLTHLMLGALQQVVPGVIAEKIVFSLIVALLPLSMLYLLNSIERGRGVMCLLGFTFAYHNLLHIGFYNFSISVSMCLFALGWWWRYKEQMTLPRLGGFYALAALTYVSHFAGFMALVVTLSITGAWCLLLRGLKALVRIRRGEFKSDLRGLAMWGLGFAGLMLPLWLSGWDYNYRFYSPEGDGYHSMADLKEVFFQTLTLTSYSDWSPPWLFEWWKETDRWHLLLWFTVGVAGITVLYRIFRLRLLEERDAILLSCGALVYLYFTLPWSRNAGGWVNDRLFILAFVLVWAWFGRFHKVVNAIVAIPLIFVSLLHTASLANDYWTLQPYLREAVAAVDKIEPHSTVDWEVNGGFRPKEYEKEGLKLVTPWLHLLSHYGRAMDVALFQNYEAGQPYFLTRWGQAPRRNPDYILSFGLANEPERLNRHLRGYDVLQQSANLSLLKRKTSPPDLKLWTTLPDGRLSLKLRMRGRDANDGIVRVARERVFSSGNFGWVAVVPRQEWRTGDRAAYSDIVGDWRDRAFRVDLPNGRYNVVCHFAPRELRPAGDGRPSLAYQTGVIANDKPVGEVVVLPGADAQTIRYSVDVDRGYLTQVFYTTWHDGPDMPSPEPTRLKYWGVSAIEIEQASPAATSQPTTQKSN